MGKPSNPKGKKPEKKTAAPPVRPAQEGSPSFPIVAIGASAGGLEAILQLLEHLPVNTGAAFVILQHLSPSHDSVLPELLERKTKMKVRKITDGMPIEADNIYVIQPNAGLSLTKAHFIVTPPLARDHGIHVIDQFLSDLATIYQNKAIAVILSGTANDGTAGVKIIKAEGGITFSQDDSARFGGMPRNAEESGFIDVVLPPDRIAAELQYVINGLQKKELRIENLEHKQDELRKIHLLLLKKHDVDFSLYKQSTIIRRIIRRMSLNRLGSLEEYLQMLRKDSKEIDLLHRDLLINVTSFFREPTLYAALSRKIFPALLKDRKPNDPLRIWIPACSTGEESYSVAICLFEYLKDKAISTPIQIFSTDLSETAISKARTGIYNKNTLANISPQRLRKFFVKIDDTYQIIKPIRDICIFATHDLLKDPPFSRMDMISCQNVLIYMEQAAQKKIMQAFHYALLPARYLVLGKSETIGGSMDLFEQVDKDLRIYSRKPAPGYMNFDFSVRGQSHISEDAAKDENMLSIPPAKETDVEKKAERLILSLYMPASILVNKDLQILRFYGATFPYLQPTSGKASLHLLKMIREELIFELRTLIKQVKKEGKAARKENLPLPENGQSREITVEVQPLRSASDAYLLIVFQPFVQQPAQVTVKRPPNYRQDEKDRRILALDKELRDARDHVKSITEDFEATREELQSANEEVLSSNEELQSINEEMETSKEELQSTNEELITINEELQLRNNDLKESVNYVKAIIETIREPLVVLNTDMRILTVNHAFYSTFHLNTDEVEGNYLFEIGRGMFDLQDLRTQLKKLAAKNASFQDFELKHTFTGLGNKVLLLNAMRMNAEPGQRARVLIAIEDITEGATAKSALFASEELFRHVSESGFINIFFFSSDGRIRDANEGFLQLVGYTREDLAAGLVRWDQLTPPEWMGETRQQMDNFKNTGRIGPYEKEYLRKDGSRFWALFLGSRLEEGLGIEFVIDISDRKRREMSAAFLSEINNELSRLRHPDEIRSAMGDRMAQYFSASHCLFCTLDAEHDGLTVDADLRRDVTPGLEGEYHLSDWFVGDLRQQLLSGEPIALPDLDRANSQAPGQRLLRQAGIRSMINVAPVPDGQTRFMLTLGRDKVYYWTDEEKEMLLEAAARIMLRLERALVETRLKESAEELLAAQSSLNIAMEAALMGVWDMDLRTGEVKRSRQHDQLLGYDEMQASWTKESWKKFLPEEDRETFEKAFSHMQQQGQLFFEGRLLRDDEPQWVRIFGRVSYDDEGRPERAAGVVLDITDQKSAERQKDEFISIASHELRTPVTGIRAYVDILLQNYLESGELPAPHLLKNMKRLTDRLTDLIRNLLDVSRIREGQMELNKTRVDLNGLIVAITEDMKRVSAGHRLILEMEEGELTVNADKARISQVLTNLLSNAIKYSPEADKVIISSSREGGMIRIAIRDFGVGLSSEDQKKVFQRFYRTLDTANRSFPGMGLGLYIAAGIVGQHGGEIQIDSQPGSGSIFTVLLPAEQAG